MPATLGQPPAKRCRQCEETNHSRSDSGPHSWSLELDQDLVDTIAAIYPEWFSSPCNKAMSQGPKTPPKAEVDSSPLHATMDKNKESLKVKLMMRRPINQLVAQGILPPLKTPPAFHEQRQKLERAKTGDLLKAKIQKRPDRDELIRQHILEADMGHVDPSLAEKQRMLKKARLADSLNDQLSHRPGPLELIKKNILHTDEPIERAVKEGQIPFKATSEGSLRKPQHPDHYVTFDEDSQSSDASQTSLPTLDATPLVVAAPTGKRDVLETAAASAGIVTVAVFQPLPAELCSPLSLGSSTSSLSPMSSVASPPTPLTPRPAPMASPAPSKSDKNKKKSKSKPQPKTRTIKFHEYKGPPSAQKAQSNNIASSTPPVTTATASISNSGVPNETSYELLLQQQQLFLQWQVELHHKYPQIILPPSQKSDGTPTTLVVTAPSNPTSPPSNDPTKFEDMKVIYHVTDLKEELKKRNLPVSVSKPQMIERLRGTGTLEPGEMETEGESSPPPPSPAPSAMDTSETAPPTSPTQTGEDIIQLQQRKIQELERELLRSQEQLAQIQRKEQPAPTPIPLKAVIQNGIIHIDPKKLFLPQQPVQTKPSNVNVKASLAARINQHQAQQQLNQLLKNRILVPLEMKKPPVYEEVAKIIKQEPIVIKPEPVVIKADPVVVKSEPVVVKQEPVTLKENVKSQIVDDLLEILIKNGELPPEAVNDPTHSQQQQQHHTAFPDPIPFPPPYIEHMATDVPVINNNNTQNDYGFQQDSSTNGNLKDFDLDLDSLGTMDFSSLDPANNNNEAMDMDDLCLSWSQNFIPQQPTMAPPIYDRRHYDPLLGASHEPFDLFNLEDSELRHSSMSWDKVDFAT